MCENGKCCLKLDQLKGKPQINGEDAYMNSLLRDWEVI